MHDGGVGEWGEKEFAGVYANDEINTNIALASNDEVEICCFSLITVQTFAKVFFFFFFFQE